MNEKKAIVEFWKAAKENNEPSARNALNRISSERINAQDDDGYTMLITAVQNGNPCAVRALLAAGRCDLDLRENLCGMTAEEFSRDFPENSPIRQAFRETATKDVQNENV